MSPKEVIEFAKKNDVKQVDIRFTRPARRAAARLLSHRRLDEDVFEEGFGFDGSSIRGWAAINEATCCSCRIRPPRSSIRS